MKMSFITTIYNEEGTILGFLESLCIQSLLPDEIVIVDGGSTDKTLLLIKNFKFPLASSKVKVFVKKGNRSIGRNEAIKHATGDIIVCSDSGNILDKNWTKNIAKPFNEKSIDVVAGYYKGLAKNTFQKCLIPYVLVMPDRIDSNTFLPATRSIAFKKTLWEQVGGFDEKLSHNEDYAFAKKMKKVGAKIVFAKDAIVYWIPRNTIRQTYIMFLRFAYGDAEASILRPKVLILFARYMIGILLCILAIMLKSVVLFIGLLIVVVVYCIWAILKNYRYVNQWQAFFILPELQFIADFAVLNGTVSGLLRLWDIKKKL